MAWTMNLEELKEYLAMVVDLEKNVFLQDQSIREINKQFDGLGKTVEIPPEPEVPTEPKRERLLWIKIPCMPLLGALAGAAGGLVIMFGIIVITLGTIIPPDSLVWGCGIIGAIIGTVGGIVGYCETKKDAQKNELEYQSEMRQYNEKIQTRNQKIKADQRRLASENRKIFALKSTIHQISEMSKETQRTLSAAYDLGIIFPKYRNLVAVCSIYEYLCSGRCSTLTGADGAYNIYETEVRLDKIITSLDVVVRELQQIKANQYMLYTAVQEGNSIARSISNGVGEISTKLGEISTIAADIKAENAAVNQELLSQLGDLEKSSALTAYNSQRIQQELAYMNRINYYSGRNDDAGAFRSIPPTW